MNAAELGDVLRGSLPALFEHSPAPRDAVRVRTPMLYPDGDLVDVFVVETDDEYLVTDFGDALGWLRMQSVGGELTANQRAFVDDVCLTLGVERDRGQLTVRCRERSELADAIHRVGQAGVRVADVEFTFRVRAPRATIADEVDGWLRAQRIEAARGVRRSGRSGHDWAVDYEVAAGAGTSLVFLVGGDNAAAVWQRAMHVFVGCSDLRELTKEGQPVALVSLFDDSTEWRDDSVNLVREVSRTVMWSQRDELARLLTSGAMPLAPP